MTSQDEQRANSRNNPCIDQPDDPARKTFIHLGDDTLAQAQRENGAAIRRLLVCRERDEWPTGYETIRELVIP